METYLFPENLFEPDAELADQAWWVLHTKPRAEKALARSFLASRVPFFLPLHKKQWRSRGRLFSSFLPLFPGYLFIRRNDYWASAPKTNQVLRVLNVPDSQRLRADLDRVYRVMQTGMAVAPEEHLHPGARVLIESGPLAGLEGRILKHGSQLRFFVEVDFIQKGMSVEIEGWMLRPLGRPSYV
jgi:transcriptional antiterminator RfaH